MHKLTLLTDAARAITENKNLALLPNGDEPDRLESMKYYWYGTQATTMTISCLIGIIISRIISAYIVTESNVLHLVVGLLISMPLVYLYTTPVALNVFAYTKRAKNIFEYLECADAILRALSVRSIFDITDRMALKHDIAVAKRERVTDRKHILLLQRAERYFFR